MTTDFMLCNVNNCNSPLINEAWVTRCSHVFCTKHGDEYFMNQSKRVKCPACNDIHNKELRVIKSNLNPHDLTLMLAHPDKAYEMITQSYKIWCYQMKIKNKINLTNTSNKYEKMLSNIADKLQTENSGLQKMLKEIDEKMKCLNQELSATKRKLHKYKTAYESLMNSAKSEISQPNSLPATLIRASSFPSNLDVTDELLKHKDNGAFFTNPCSQQSHIIGQLF